MIEAFGAFRGARRRLALAAGTLLGGLLLPALPAAAACPNAEARAGEVSLAELEQATVCLVNELRDAHGIRPLERNHKLAVAGARHASDMVEHGYFGHSSRDGSEFSARIFRTGYVTPGASWILGENLAWGTGEMSNPRSRVDAWFASPSHRRIMLDRRFVEIGVAVARGAPYLTRFSAAATYAAEFGTVWIRSVTRRPITRARWSSSGPSGNRPKRFSAAAPH